MAPGEGGGGGIQSNEVDSVCVVRMGLFCYNAEGNDGCMSGGGQDDRSGWRGGTNPSEEGRLVCVVG